MKTRKDGNFMGDLLVSGRVVHNSHQYVLGLPTSHEPSPPTSMVVSGSPKRWYVAYNPPIGSIYHLYTTYILPSRGLYNPYHPLQEPEKSTDNMSDMM